MTFRESFPPLPTSKPELPTKRGIFMDVEILGSVTISGDVISQNWDGARPPSLATRDSAANAGYALDSSAGGAQFVNIFADGGELRNLSVLGALTLGSGGIIRTAASGARTELKDQGSSTGVSFYTGDVSETQPSAVWGSIGYNPSATPVAQLASGTFGSFVRAAITLLGERSGQKSAIWLRGDSLDVSNDAGNQSLTLSAGGVLRLGLGTVGAPSISFIADTDTGIYRIGANNLGVTTAGALVAQFTTNAFKGNGTTGGPLIRTQSAGGVSTPIYSFDGDNDTGMYRNAANQLAFAAGGVETFRGHATRNYLLPAYGDTTGSAANAIFISSDGRLGRSTSARKYKSRINYNMQKLADIELKPTKFYRKDDSAWYYGFIADDLAGQDKLLGVFNDDEIENYDQRAVMAVMAAKINRLEANASI